MSLLILSASDIDTLTSHFAPRDLMLLMAKTFSVFSSSGRQNPGKKLVDAPQRLNIRTANHTVLFMPARIEADLGVHGGAKSKDSEASSSGLGGDDDSEQTEGHTAIKIVSVPMHADPRGLPATTAVLDEKSGAIRAIVNARKLTALRNAATSLLSTTLLAPPHPTTITAFGAGKQVESHLELHIRHFGASIQKCSIINRSNNERVASLVASLSAKYPGVEFELLISDSTTANTQVDSDTASNLVEIAGSAHNAVENADIIICATSSTKPLFPSSWVRSGTHVILIGSYTPAMREVEVGLVRRARCNHKLNRDSTVPIKSSTSGDSTSSTGINSTSGSQLALPSVLVDSREACLHEAGELLDAKLRAEQLIEIGEVIPLLSPSASAAGLDSGVDVQQRGGRVVDTMAFEEILAQPRPQAQPQGQERTRDFEGPITMFKSVGVGIQDVAIAKAMVDEAEKRGVGVVLRDYDT